MEFLELFFPYQNLLSGTAAAINPWFVIAIVVFFTYQVLPFLWGVFRLKKALRRHAPRLEVEQLRQDRLLANPWWVYEHTFLPQPDGNNKTAHAAQNFFVPTDLLTAHVNLKALSAVPGILLALGIFGTFLGLTLGIEGFDTSDTASIQSSIQVLLGGMATAFLTSLWGMSLSIVFTIVERAGLGLLARHARRFSDAADRKFKLSAAELQGLEHQREHDKLCQEEERARAAFQQAEESQRRLLVEFFRAEKDGQSLLPKDLWLHVLINSEEQTRALKSFSTDLADGIKISSETIENLGQRLAAGVEQQLMEALTPVLDRLNASVESLRQEKQQSSGEFMERVATELQSTLRELVAQFQTSISGSAVKQLEDLASTVASAGAALTTFPAQFSDAMSSFRAGIEELRSSVTGSAHQALTSAEETTRQLQQQTLQVLENLQTQTLELTRQVHDQAASAANDLQQRSDEMSNRLSETMDQMWATLQKNMQLTSEHLQQKTAATAGELHDKASAIADQMQENARSAFEWFEGTLQKSTKDLQQQVERMQQNVQGLFARQEQSVKATTDLLGGLDKALSRTVDVRDSLHGTVQELGVASTRLNSSSDTAVISAREMRTAGETLARSTAAFQEANREYVQTHQRTLEELQKALRDAEMLGKQYGQQFTTIQSGLQGIFQEIQTGLEGYSRVARDSINQYLSGFTEQVTAAVRGLAGGVEELGEVVDGITEAAAKINGQA